MSTFADSSALVRLYADEPGFEHVRAIGDLAVCDLARVEVASALWRKAHTGEIEWEDAVLLDAWFAGDWYGDTDHPPRFAAVGVTAAVLDRAVSLIGRHALRSLDAIQLAAALAARDADPACVGFACFDRRLSRAAEAEGFALVP